MPESRFKEFWETLSPAYPVSKGAFKLPIVTDLIELPKFDATSFIQNLEDILSLLLEKNGTKEQDILRATVAGEERIVPLIDENYTGIVRFDCVIDEVTGDVKVLELNCDYPDGLILHDKTYSVLSGTESKKHQDLLLSLFEPNDSVVITHDKKAGFLDAYHAEKIAFTDNLKNEASIESDLQLINPLVVRRCLEVSKLSDEDCVALGKMPRTYVNSFALRTLGYKNLLSDLTHTYIPKTIVLTSKNSSQFEENKDSWILKPLEGCEGNGIYFGKDVSEADWKALLSELSDTQYVAQEFVTLSKLLVPLYQDGTIIEKELYYDLCPHFFIKHGKIVGHGYTLMRFSEHPIVNVTKGGGIGYLKM